MLKFVEISNLFNLYSYRVDMNNGDGHPVRYLTGPNGYGKTTLLSLVYSVMSSRFDMVFVVPFTHMMLDFGELQLVVDKEELYEQNDNSDERVLKDRQVIIRLEKHGRLMQSVQVSQPEELKGVIGLVMRAMDVFYLTDQRVILSSTSYAAKEYHTMATTLQQYANQLLKMIEECEFKLPINEIETSENSCKKETYQAFILQTAPRMERLAKVGVVSPSFKYMTYTEGTAYLLHSYMELVMKELERVETIASKLLLFDEVVEEAKFSNKILRIDKNCGFKFYTNTTNPCPLLFEQLSLGECHLLLQLYALIFEAPEHALVLLDEPELSMHMYWQLHYDKLISKIARNRHLQFVVSTHSPHIAGGVWSHTIDLYRQLQK